MSRPFPLLSITRSNIDIFWKISFNKLVTYLNRQNFSVDLSDQSNSNIATANTINIVNDLLTTVEFTNDFSFSTYNIANIWYNNSVNLVSDLSNVVNNSSNNITTSTEKYNYSNTTIRLEKTPETLDTTDSNQRFNVVTLINANGELELGKYSYINSNTNPGTPEMDFDESFYIDYDSLNFELVLFYLNGSEIIFNRKSEFQESVAANSLIIKSYDDQLIIKSYDDQTIIGKKTDWINPNDILTSNKGFLNTANSVPVPIVFMPGTSNSTIHFLKSLPKRWNNSDIGLKIYTGNGEPSNTAHLEIKCDIVEPGTLLETVTTDIVETNSGTVTVANNTTSTDIINIPVSNDGNENLLLFSITRNVGHSADTLTSNLFIHGIEMIYGTKHFSDN